MKNTVSEMKNTWDEINILDTVEGTVSELENRAIGTIQME